MKTFHWRHLSLLVLTPLVALGFAACGDDDDGGGDAGPSDGAGEYCDAILRIETLEEPDLDFESMTEAEIESAVKEFFDEELLPLAEDARAAAPPEVEGHLAVLVDATREIAETGDFSVFDEDEVAEAEAGAHAYDLENCGWGQSDVAALDYAFQGVARSYDAGPVSFDLTNEGEEMHEMAILRKNDGTTESFDELFAMEEEQALTKVELVAIIEPTAPGDDDYAVADLEEGDYAVVCFLPVGATPDAFEAVESGAGDPSAFGPPHFTEGMKAEFSVG